jgi:hypothetical protein
VSGFFVNTQDGRVATHAQLDGADLLDERKKPVAPWHPIQGPDDASTLWYAVLRKRERGVFIGTLCFRHSERQASLLESGWDEVELDAIGV